MKESERFMSAVRNWTEAFTNRGWREMVLFAQAEGLSFPQMTTLLRISKGGCGISELGNHLEVTSAAASQLVDRLVHQGLLERTEDPKDRRAKQLSLTPRAQELAEKMIQVRYRWMDELTTRLDREQQAEVSAALEVLTRAVLDLEERAVKAQGGQIAAAKLG